MVCKIFDFLSEKYKFRRDSMKIFVKFDVFIFYIYLLVRTLS